MFEFVKSNQWPNCPIIKQMQAKASVTYAIGDALYLSGGVLEKATGTTVPEYIAAEAYVAPASNAKKISVYKISSQQEWKTTFAADASAVAEGSKVTIHTDAAQVTATTTSGIFQLLNKLGTGASGTSVIGRF